MANVAFQQLMSQPVITRAISEIQVPKTRLQEFFGMGPGGNAVSSPGGDIAGWDIFNFTRSQAQARARNVGPGTIAPQPMGQRTARFIRLHEKMHLAAERVFRTRPIGGNYGMVDNMGQSYITRQQAHLAQRFRNSREWMVSRLFRGGFEVLMNGDLMTPVDIGGGGHFTVDYGIPAGNKLQVDLLGGGNLITQSWANPATSILAQVMSINGAFEQLHGLPLKHLWMNSVTFQYMLDNDQFKELGGTSNKMWDSFEPNGTAFEVTMKAIPWLRIHIYDAGLDNASGSFTKFFPDGYVGMTPDPSPDWAELLEGSEIVMENVLDPGTERYGFAAWQEPVTQPAGWELIAVDNIMPVVYRPQAIIWAQVIF